MAARLLEVRCRFPVVFFFVFTWNVEFVCHKYTSISGPNFFVRKRSVHETVSSTRITGAGTNPSLKKIGKTPSSHIIHSPEGEHCWRVRDSKPIRLLESPRSPSGYIVMSHVWCPTSDVRNPMFDVRCPLSDVWCPTSDARIPMSDVRSRCAMCGV